MKLSAESKKNLLGAANQVYMAYAALDFFKAKKFETLGGHTSLNELCKKAIAENKLDHIFLINGASYTLKITPGPKNTFKVQFKHVPVHTNEVVPVKKINAYDDQEVLDLLTEQNFTFEIPFPDAEPIVSNEINEEHIIGGKGKFDLYRTHLVTLHNIIEKLESEEDVSSLLVALATGSGKTFVQALWVLVLSLSGNNGVFAVPDKLVLQFSKDLKRLLPDNLVNKILALREHGENAGVQEALNSLANNKTSGQFIIGSSETLLDNHYQQLLKAQSDKTFFAFDEQHLIMQHERRRVRLKELSQQKLSMFLTATPNPETYAMSGQKPVAIMSSGQKQEAGQGQFPRLMTQEAQNISDRNALRDYRFWTLPFWENMLNGFLLRLTNAIQEEQSSAAVSLVEELPFYHYSKKDETDVRWRMQVPFARKMLVVIDDNETLVNFCHAMQDSEGKRRDVYRDGNLINRADVAEFFSIPDAEKEVIAKYMKHRREDYLESLSSERSIGEKISRTSLKDQLEYNIFHNLIEYVLTDVTGLDEIEQNRRRKEDPKGFQALILKKFQLRTVEYYQAKLAREIDPQGAKEIGGLLADLSLILSKMVENTRSPTKHWPDPNPNKIKMSFTQRERNAFTERQCLEIDKVRDAEYAIEQKKRAEAESPRKLAAFIDNWYLNYDLVDNIKKAKGTLGSRFNAYAKNHLMIGVMAGMGRSETVVAESQPFSGLVHVPYNMYDGNGALIPDAKKRKHTSLEILNDTSQEHRFTPSYLAFSEETADAYVRLGFVGMYVSNKKSEGFSDRNLHTVINLAEKTLSTTNSPTTEIQVIGRNRGLDDTIEPAYIHSLGRNQKTVFGLDNLKKTDYYPDLFKAQEQYNKDYVEVLGEQVSQQIIAWIVANVDKDETINPDHLKRQVLKFIAKALRDINNKNSHEISLSRAQLTQIVGYAMQGIDKEIAHIKKPYQLSYFLKGLSYFLNFVCECYYTVKSFLPNMEILRRAWFGARTPVEGDPTAKHPDDVYIKIINKTNYKDIVSKVSTFLEFKNWIMRKKEGIETHLKKHVFNYLKQEATDQFAVHQKEALAPLLVKMVVDSKQAHVAAAMANYPGMALFLQTHLPTLEQLLENHQSKKFQEKMLALLQQIPGLEDLAIRDMVNYPKSMADKMAMLEKNPLHIVKGNAPLKADLTKNLGEYLKNEFPNHLTAFMTYPQAHKVKQLLAEENKAQEFVTHCMDKLVAGEQFSQEFLFRELKIFFRLEQLTTLAEDMQHLQDGFTGLQDKIAKKPFQHMASEPIDQVVGIFKNKLLPAMVNAYPREYRADLLAKATNENIRTLLMEHGSELAALQNEGDGAKFANFMFTNLNIGSLPVLLNPEAELNAVKTYFKTQLTNIMIRGAASSPFLAISSFFTKTPVAFEYDKAIADLLKREDFFNVISSLIPHNQWTDLKSNLNQNDSARLKIAQRIFAMGDKAASLSSEDILALLNEELGTHYVSTQDAVVIAGGEIAGIIEPFKEDPLAHLSIEAQNQFVALTQEQLLPLLASFIKDNAKKGAFLAQERGHHALYGFISANVQKLALFQGSSGDELKQKVLDLINQLLPEGSKLVLDDLLILEQHVEKVSELLKTDMNKLTIISFLSSSTFKELIKDVFNQEDFTLVMGCLGTQEQITAFAEQLIDEEVVLSDKNAVFDALKAKNPCLIKIKTIDQRLTNFKDYIGPIKENYAEHIDKEAVSGMLMESLAPILFHKRYLGLIDNILGFLNEEDMTAIFRAAKKENPQQIAGQFKQFITLIKEQNKKELIRLFMKQSDDTEASDFEKLPLRQMMDHLQELIGEVFDCHCYYNDQGRKGDGGTETPKLHTGMSEEVRDLRVSTTDSFFSEFSRKLFYIHGINRGVSDAGKVSADSNQHLVKELERVKSHILRPIWWGTNLSKVGHGFVKGCRDVVFGIVAGYYWGVNGGKKLLNWISGSDYFTISVKNQDSKDYNDTAFDFASAINELDPLEAKHVEVEACPTDVVVHMEDFIEKRRARHGFFGGHLGVVPKGDEELAEEDGFAPDDDAQRRPSLAGLGLFGSMKMSVSSDEDNDDLTPQPLK